MKGIDSIGRCCCLVSLLVYQSDFLLVTEAKWATLTLTGFSGGTVSELQSLTWGQQLDYKAHYPHQSRSSWGRRCAGGNAQPVLWQGWIKFDSHGWHGNLLMLAWSLATRCFQVQHHVLIVLQWGLLVLLTEPKTRKPKLVHQMGRFLNPLDLSHVSICQNGLWRRGKTCWPHQCSV